MEQFVQIVGAVLVLSGYALTQMHILGLKSSRYLLLNLVGSGLLALTAGIEKQWGFLLLNGVWAIVSLVSLSKVTFEAPSRESTEERK